MDDKEMKRVAVFGWYGHGNFGDYLMLEGLKRLFRNWQVTVMSNSEESSYPVIDFDVVNECDLFVLGGGELVNADYLFVRGEWAKYIKIPKVILGCGVNVEKPKHLKAKAISELERFDYIGLRDKTALGIVQSVPQLKDKAELFYDFAFALDVAASEQRCFYAVVVPTDRFTSKWDRGIQQCNVAKKSRGWLQSVLASYSETYFLPFGTEDNDDYETCRFLLPYSRNWRLMSNLSFKDTVALLSKAAFVVSYRLHGMILAHMVNAPFTYYPYHWKLTRVFESIKFLEPIRIKQRQNNSFAALMKMLGFSA